MGAMCEKGIDCCDCNSRGMCSSYAAFMYKKGIMDSLQFLQNNSENCDIICNAIKKINDITQIPKMRETTKEEKEAINNYINSISVDTGINIFDLMNENVPYKNKLEQVEDILNEIDVNSENVVNSHELIDEIKNKIDKLR